MKNLFFCLLIFLVGTQTAKAQETKNPKVDYLGFVELSDSLYTYREARLINEKTFMNYRTQRNTIVLDTRSKAAYDDIHIEGAIHLNFSDFTSNKLEQIIPNKETRILIYCNNNFESNRVSLLDKSVKLALNIPTFINLFGYGYENIYELKGYLKEDDCLIPLVGN